MAVGTSDVTLVHFDHQPGWARVSIDQHGHGVLADLVKARRERDALTENLNKAQRRSALVELRAPIDATVLEINKRSVGSVSKEAEPIVTLVPQGVPLQAEIQIPADEIGFVRKDDAVRIKIDAFPFQRHGTVDGKLTAIGEDSFVSDGASRGRPMTKAFYPARVGDLRSDLKKVPTDTRLTPGMTLVAEIKVSERSVLSYCVYPLVKAFDEGIPRAVARLRYGRISKVRCKSARLATRSAHTPQSASEHFSSRYRPMDFIDLKTQYRHLRESVNALIQKVLGHGQFILGPEVAELEQRLAAYVGVTHCVTAASGTPPPRTGSFEANSLATSRGRLGDRR